MFATNPFAVCAQEPIHIPGAIQPHGALLAIDPAAGFTVVAASRNAATFLPGVAIGLELESILGAEFAAGVHRRFDQGTLRGEAPWQSSVNSGNNGTCTPFHADVHAHGGLILIELERADPTDQVRALSSIRELQEAIVELRVTSSKLEQLARVTARGIRALTGYERVLIYRFDTEWNGQALGEDKIESWEQSLDGLHFPASDIPAQARELYRRSLLRWVPDRNAIPVPLDIDPTRTGNLPPQAIDLSFARLRALSPIHLQYHRNMGVNGSMSLSILAENRLWGLIVCHHRKPHFPAPCDRVAALALTEALALRVGSAERGDAEHARRGGQTRLLALLADMAEAEGVAAALTNGDTNIGNLLCATGACVIYEGVFSTLGQTPPKGAIRELAVWLRHQGIGEKIYHTDKLAAAFPAWQPHLAIASGVLAVFLAADRSDMLLWFRPEEPQLVNWGGDPSKEVAADLSVLPRQSFERWVETRHGVATPWAEWELEIAEALRHGIADVVVRSLRRIAQLNDQLRQSQKMEAVGQLTGGIAHDFNNLLTGILGSLEMIRGQIDPAPNGTVDRYITAAMSCADRAAALTHRLLSFSRQQTLDSKPVDIAQLAASMEDLIRRTMGPGIDVETAMPAGLWRTLCDANQLENALLNLAINARDAMPDGGRLTIAAANFELGEESGPAIDIPAADIPAADIPPGQYVAVSVTDTGSGMKREIIARVFEPFFTTKPVGAGTGLGLSMVYGFARQSNGGTGIDSEPGRGTTVRLYLPRHIGQDETAVGDIAAPAPVGARPVETVLVVDDEAIVRMLVGDVLRNLGYGVIEAADAAEAMEAVRSKQRIDLMVSDIGLPGGTNGRQLALLAREQRSQLKVLFITGYADKAARGTPDAGMQMIAKPFAMEALAARIRSML